MFSEPLQRAMNWILGMQSSLGGWSGPWTDRDWSGAWTTAGVIYAYHNLHQNLDETRIQAGIAWLLGQQNEDGGWPRVFSDFSSTESTAWAIMALTKARPRSRELAKGVDWLLESQRPDGGWDYYNTPASESRVIPTCFVILAMTESGYAVSDTVDKAIRWVRSQRLPDGSWANTNGRPADCMSTALSLLCLTHPETKRETNERSVEKSIHWLISKQTPEGSWPHGTDRIFLRTYSTTSPGEKPLESLKDVYWEWYSTPWVLTALSSSRMSIASPAMQTGISYIFESQRPDGGWALHLEGNPIFFATYQTIYCLVAIEQNIDVRRDYDVFASRLKAKDELIRQLRSDPILAEEHQSLAREVSVSKPIVFSHRRGIFLSQKLATILLVMSLLQFSILLTVIIAPQAVYAILVYLNQQYLKVSISTLSLVEGTLILLYFRKVYKMSQENFYAALFGLALTIIFYLLA